MAFSLEQIRAKLGIRLHGRRIGFTKGGATARDFIGGFKDILRPVTNATSSTTATALLPYGMHTVVTTTNDTWTLSDPPFAGLVVQVGTNSTSTGDHTVSPAAATITSTNGVAGSSIVMQGVGAFIELTSLSSAAWIVTSRGGSTTAGATVTVSS